jgi:acyl-coenzyme A thioesterase PaaI-like protein
VIGDGGARPSADPAPEGMAEGPVDPELIRSRLYERWQAPDPDQLTPERLEKRRLADAIRQVIGTLTDTGAPTDLVTRAADDLERIVARFADIPTVSRYQGYRETANVGDDPHASFELSPFIGLANPLAPPISLTDAGDRVLGTVTFGSAYEGPPGCVHGGYIAAAFDELLGATQSLSGAPGMTGTLTVRYRSPTPLDAELAMAARIREVQGRKIYVEGTLHVGDRLCAEAEGVFISIDVSVFQALKADREARVLADRDAEDPR